MQRLSRRTLDGIVVTVGATLVTSGSGLIAQIVLGRYLSKHDFAWYAIAMSWCAFAIAIRNAGTQQVLLRSGSRFNELAEPILNISIVANGALFLAVSVAALVVSSVHQVWTIALLMLCIGLYVPLGTWSPIYLAKLASDGRFGTIAFTNSVSALVRAVSAIIFALAGLGAMSLALPFLLVVLSEFIMGKRNTALTIRSRRPTAVERAEIWSQSKWIVFGALSVALVLNGDYLAIGMFGSKAALADYFFGFQLTAAVASLLANGIQTVMLPTFVSLADSAERQIQAFSRATATLMIISVGTCFLVALIARPAIHIIWGGKWDDATIVVQLMAITLPLRLLMPLGRALLESRGLWRISAPLTFADGIGIFFAAAVGAWVGSVAAIAIAVAIYRALAAIAHYCITRQRVGVLSLDRIWRQVLSPLGCGIAALLLASFASSLVTKGDWTTWFVAATVFVAAYGAALLTLFREDCIYLFQVLRRS